MAKQYDRYLNRLRNIKANRPEMQMYERNTAMMAQPFNILNRKVAQMTQAGGASTAAQVAALNEGRSQWNQMQQQGFGQAMAASAQREGQLDMKIAEVEFAKGQYEEHKKEEKKAKRTAALRAGLQAAGMIVGGVAAAATGGMSLLAGAGLGGSIGQTVGGFMGINKKGQLTADMAEWDSQAIVQGLASTAGQFEMYANQKDTKGKLGVIGEYAETFQQKFKDDPEGMMLAMMRIQHTFNFGSEMDMRNLFESFFRIEQAPDKTNYSIAPDFFTV